MLKKKVNTLGLGFSGRILQTTIKNQMCPTLVVALRSVGLQAAGGLDIDIASGIRLPG